MYCVRLSAFHPRYPAPITFPSNSFSTNRLYCCTRVFLKSWISAWNEPLGTAMSVGAGGGTPLLEKQIGCSAGGRVADDGAVRARERRALQERLRHVVAGVVGETVAAAKDDERRERRRKANAWRQVAVVGLDIRRTGHTVLAGDQDLRRSQIDVDEMIVALGVRREDVVAQAGIDRQPRIDTPVVLHEGKGFLGVVVRIEERDDARHLLRITEQERGDAVAARPGPIVGQCRVERHVAERLVALIDGEVAVDQSAAHLQASAAR